MDELLNRLHLLFTGVRIDALNESRPEAYAPGAGAFAGMFVITGWDKIRERVPDSWFPFLILEPGQIRESKSTYIKNMEVNIDIGVRVSGVLGALFGRGTTKGLLEIETLVAAALRADPTLAGYTRSITDINTTQEYSLKGYFIERRYSLKRIGYDKIAFEDA